MSRYNWPHYAKAEFGTNEKIGVLVRILNIDPAQNAEVEINWTYSTESN